MSLLESVQERLHRHQDRAFLKAAMAASALAAYADGTVSLSERYSIDEMLENVERLNIHDPDKAVQILNDYVHALKSDPELALATAQLAGLARGYGGIRARGMEKLDSLLADWNNKLKDDPASLSADVNKALD